MALTQYRKPENVLRFFVYLLAHPGSEINMSTLSKEIGVERRVVEENLPRLIMTDLIIRIRKFTHQPLRVRQGSIKCYPIDLALRNAVLKTWHDFTSDPALMGIYAENLVAHEVCKWTEAIEVAYYREKSQEVDFVIPSLLNGLICTVLIDGRERLICRQRREKFAIRAGMFRE